MQTKEKTKCSQCDREVTEIELSWNPQICQQCQDYIEVEEQLYWDAMRNLEECDDIAEEFFED